jgi:hypothetical protein
MQIAQFDVQRFWLLQELLSSKVYPNWHEEQLVAVFSQVMQLVEHIVQPFPSKMNPGKQIVHVN